MRSTPKEDLNLTDEMMATRRYQMFDWGYRVYEHIPLRVHGDRRQPLRSRFRRGAIRDHVQFPRKRFNEGSWSAYYNPDDCYTSYYNGIYAGARLPR